MEINSYHSLLRNKNKCSHLGIPKNEKEKQKGRRKYLKVSVLQWRQRNAKRKKEITEGECVVAEEEKCESKRRRGKCGGGDRDISYKNDGEIDEKRVISRTENATFLEPSSYFVSFF